MLSGGWVNATGEVRLCGPCKRVPTPLKERDQGLGVSRLKGPETDEVESVVEGTETRTPPW